MVSNTKLKYLEYCKMSEEQVRSLASFLEYKDLIDFSSYLLNEGKDFLKLEGTKALLDITVMRIWNKYEKRNGLSKKELKVFLDIFFQDNIDYFNLDERLITKEYVSGNDPRLMGKIAVVYHNLKRDFFPILYSEDFLNTALGNNLFINLYNTMIMVSHEQAHVQQNFDIMNKVDLKTFIISLEEAAQYHDRKYYVSNYDHLYTEMDANNKGGHALHNFFKKHRLLNKTILDEVKGIYFNEDEEALSKFIANKVTYNGKTDYALRQLMEINKELIGKFNFFLESFPLLQISHNWDGTIKTVPELVRERQRKIDKKDKDLKGYEEIYGFIFDKYYGISLEDAMEIEKKDREAKKEAIKPKSLLKKLFKNKKETGKN